MNDVVLVHVFNCLQYLSYVIPHFFFRQQCVILNDLLEQLTARNTKNIVPFNRIYDYSCSQFFDQTHFIATIECFMKMKQLIVIKLIHYIDFVHYNFFAHSRSNTYHFCSKNLSCLPFNCPIHCTVCTVSKLFAQIILNSHQLVSFVTYSSF